MLKLQKFPAPALMLMVTLMHAAGCAQEPVPQGGSRSDGVNSQDSPAAASDVRSDVIRFETEWGEILVEIDLERAPITGREFLQHVRDGHLDDSSFYRTVTLTNQPGHPTPIEVIQGGRLPWIEGADPEFPGFEHETTAKSGLLHLDGTLSMARDEPGTATTEFFICIGAQPELDFGGARNPDGQGFAAFGQVISGMDVVHKIHRANQSEQKLEPPIQIQRVAISGE